MSYMPIQDLSPGLLKFLPHLFTTEDTEVMTAVAMSRLSLAEEPSVSSVVSFR
jgi:hypothetical protein